MAGIKMRRPEPYSSGFLAGIVSRVAVISVALVMVSSRAGLAETATKGLVVQFSRQDLTTVERAIQNSLGEAPVVGRSDTPMQTPYTFGTITVRGISYGFQPELDHISLLSDAFSFDLSIRQLQGQIDRVEFNDSGSMYCEKIPVRSGAKGGRGTIPVHVVAHPRTLPDGSVVLDIPVSEIGLDERNFIVGEPESCDVIFGFNWLLKWMLPNLIKSYKQDISHGLAKTLASTLKDGVLKFSPLLTLRVTLPFDPGDIPAFYATVGISPSGFSVTPDRLQSFFATDITIDPDPVTPFSDDALWPDNLSLIGLNWSFLNAMFHAASEKNIIRATINQRHRAGGVWTTHEPWRQVWPRFSEALGNLDPVTIRLDGGAGYGWRKGPDNTASLDMNQFRVTLAQGSDVLAAITLSLTLDITLRAEASGEVGAIVTNLVIHPRSVAIDAGAGKLAHTPFQDDGIARLSENLRQQIQAAPESSRSLFKVLIPALQVGDHKVLIRNIYSAEAGIILPLEYLDRR
jgi:hypothetical protein